MALSCRSGAALKKYLLLLAQENCEFRLPEIRSLISLYCGNCNNIQDNHGKSPFCVLSIPCEELAKKIMKRTVCAKSLFELWGHGKSLTELQQSIQNYSLDKMAMEFLPFKGKVSLQNAEHIFYVLEDYGPDPNSAPKEPLHIYFGRWIADGQRELIDSYSVKKRHFIGNTSMDAGLSFIMANHARVKPNDVVFDPFVGTGGLLVPCAHFGAYVCGTEIDYNTVHGRGKATRMNQKWRGPDENIRANLRQYGLEKHYLDVLVSDASKPIWRKGPLFDAIITDPPYGIRESTRKTGTQKEIMKTDQFPESHVPVQLTYHLNDIFLDLLNFAAEFLVVGGRLVYWLPVYKPEYTEEVVPRHPCLKLISNCEQMLSSHTSRRLITMEKVKEFEDKDQYAHLEDGPYLQYQGHNSFRDKYFSGLTKRIAREERARAGEQNTKD
ncbi:tRNA (guanine(10)-N(2))-methyltransferase TRMT11 isoform X2 [Mixophyes fleayi]|uniref:tRNA (guanine(10)-N(2))-methyltransferase TRMT11 isoform X2 n=1 Tax=Mixophyes fleayi TaxID=3061075 RepID=UPI003F4DAA96